MYYLFSPDVQCKRFGDGQLYSYKGQQEKEIAKVFKLKTLTLNEFCVL